jgi:hypothetical protein
LDERISAVLTIEGSLNGSLVVEIRFIEARIAAGVGRAALTLTAWREDGNGVRMSLRNPATGSIAHFQSGESLLGFVREIGIEIAE